MLAAISINHAAHQHEHGNAVAEGFKRHGVNVRFVKGDSVYGSADFHVTWSVKRPAIFQWHRQTKRPVLVMERGHVGDRMTYSSCGWNGLGRRGVYPQAPNADRWKSLWSHLMQPWNEGGSYALLLGQVEGDASLYRLAKGFDHWAQQQTDALRKLGYGVVFRPHPFVKRYRTVKCPTGAKLSSNDALMADLRDAAFAVCFNSTASVECVLAGVPTITLDAGSMAWDVSAHQLVELVKPDRMAWAVNLSYTQWNLSELKDGTAWEHLKTVVSLEGACI